MNTAQEPGLVDNGLELNAESVGSGVHGLMRAVLVDAIHCLVGGRRGGGVRNREWRPARRWLLDTSEDWLFSFVSICRELDIDATLLRRRLLTSMVAHSNLLPQRGSRRRLSGLRRGCG